MEYNENEWHISQNSIGGSPVNAQVPSSLLSTVLHRLGLEQAHSEISVDDLVAKLKSDDWEVRLRAVRTLGKLEVIPIELLVAVLDDEDVSVRAAAVHALGKTGKRAPLDRLVAALHDPDWHVRETAVLALGKQGQRVPHEVLTVALHDTDASVREASRLALQWNGAEERTPAIYGQLKEQKTTMAYDIRNGSIEGIENSTSSHGMRQQAQEYAPGWEKIIPHRKPQRAWLAVVAITAFLFFLMGGGLAVWLMPSLVHVSSVSKSAVPQPTQLPLEKFILNPIYSLMVQKDIGTALHLDPGQITGQLKSGKSMSDIAAAQGVSASQLTTIEINAFRDVFDNAASSGDIDQQSADQWIQQLQSNPQFLDRMTVLAFVPGLPGK